MKEKEQKMEPTLNSQLNDAKKYANTAVKEVEKTARDIKSRVEDRMSDSLDDARSMYSQVSSEAQKRAREAADYAAEVVKDRPLTTVLSACALGLVAGYMLGRRR